MLLRGLLQFGLEVWKEVRRHQSREGALVHVDVEMPRE